MTIYFQLAAERFNITALITRSVAGNSLYSHQKVSRSIFIRVYCYYTPIEPSFLGIWVIIPLKPWVYLASEGHFRRLT